MDSAGLCRSLLLLVDAIPSTRTWHVVTTDHPNWLFIADARPEALTIEMVAIASSVGEVVAQECIHSRRDDGKPIIGAIIEIGESADSHDVASQLHAAYALATAGDSVSRYR